MKLHFEPNLDFQRAAINSVCDLFEGQETTFTAFSVTRPLRLASELFDEHDRSWAEREDTDNDLGIGNRLSLVEEELIKNLRRVQARNELAMSDALNSMDFTVEMETGTGKTYVYLRTIFELNKQYGFTKFVVVVPSVAIKEGVYKSLQIMKQHFKALYEGTTPEFFSYDSAKLGEVRDFATSSQIRIMVTTVGAINKKDVNNLYKETERLGGEKPIDLIRATRPIIIVDEPQSVDGGLKGAGRTALSAMNPLCTLRYSATHVDKHHMVYKLDALDAYQRGLVKKIEIDSGTVEDNFNTPYIHLSAIEGGREGVHARLTLNVRASSGVRREVKTVRDGDDLRQVAGGLGLYDGYRIGEIKLLADDKFLTLIRPGLEDLRLSPGETSGDLDRPAVVRQMIRRTIKEHLEKEVRLHRHGIKVLSLFFIDSVDRYRAYDEDGTLGKGEYARIFEEEYAKLVRENNGYRALFEELSLDLPAADEVHEGYFSIDRKTRRAVDTIETNASGREAAEEAYRLIMRDKEQLLSFETPLRFIFSHSALGEGWDNPNVFQICSLRPMKSERERRQTVGRGLRLCVDQGGERLRGAEYNLLTVIADENYLTFADALQKGIEEAAGIKLGRVQADSFVTIALAADVIDADPEQLGQERSRQLFAHFISAGHLDKQGRIQDSLRKALQDNAIEVPPEFAPQLPDIIAVLTKLSEGVKIANKRDRRKAGVNKKVYTSAEFTALWERIKHKTTYRVDFDNEKLIDECVKELRRLPRIPPATMRWRKAGLAFEPSGIHAREEQRGSDIVALESAGLELPDLLTTLQDRTQLTRRSLCRILAESNRLADFIRNPQRFIDEAAETINMCKQLALVGDIKYEKIGDEQYFAQELFGDNELIGYVDKMLENSPKSVMESVLFDSIVEKQFAERLEASDRVKIYTKLPREFTIPTPLGPYNPDWAVVATTPEGEKLYFIVETKGNLKDLRNRESAKIHCGGVHVDAIADGDNPARFEAVDKADEFLLWA